MAESKSFEPLRDIIRHRALPWQAGFAEAVDKVVSIGVDRIAGRIVATERFAAPGILPAAAATNIITAETGAHLENVGVPTLILGTGGNLEDAG